jgi:NDP-sugar pyrophosphorylase family protein
MRDYQGVILAAGQGKRMGPLGEEYPKALLPVGDEPIIGHQLRLFGRLGIRDVYAVIGHLGSKIIDAIGDGSRYGLNIHFVEQGPALGSAFALGRAIPYLRKPFVVTLGDYYFEAPEAEALMRSLENGRSAISAKRELNRTLLREACELRVCPDGRLEQIVEKPADPSGNLKGCGFYAMQTSFLDSVARTPRTALRDEYELSISLEVHLSAGRAIYVEDIIKSDWNFTRARDVLDCNLDWLKRRGQQAFVAQDAQIDPEALLEEVVVGTGAHLNGAVRLTRSVVFPNARAEGGPVVESALVTPTNLLRV